MLDHTEFNTSGNGRIEKKISREQAYRCYAGYDVPNDYSNDEEILCSVSQHLNNGYYVHKTSCSCPFKGEYPDKIVPLDMKGCICHFVKWQIHPFISNGIKCSRVDFHP